MRTLSDDNKAVSPVIGVILMVAITVLLAATAAVFFLQFGEDQNNSGPKQAVFEMDYDASGSDEVKIKHTSGDTLKAKNVEIVISNAQPNGIEGRYSLVDDFAYGANSEVSSGVTVKLTKSTLGAGTDIDFSKATVKVVYAETSGSTSKIFRKWDGPKK